ncbi:MAG: epoxyqueuosine reductase [Clostridia bacterium]|nr:epoxyqueuosine reductase [Clostridia bacterium]
MKKRISELLLAAGIDCFGFLPLEACSIQKPHLLERCGVHCGSVALFAIPYYTRACDGARNLSSYAVGKDYHLYFKMLSEQILDVLRTEFPQNRFAAFADHSPIDERRAAALAGLGVIGKNGLLITEKYSSYVFLGEIITDAHLDALPRDISPCIGCGACHKVCPQKTGECSDCLSSLTQRKGELSPSEESVIRKYNSAWGCDLCQEVCPYTVNAKKRGTLYTPLDFFSEETRTLLSTELLTQMDDEAFSKRAYSWRGREVISRNLALLEKRNALTKDQSP